MQVEPNLCMEPCSDGLTAIDTVENGGLRGLS